MNGTPHCAKQELVEYMESIGMRLGAGVNASTSFDETVYNLRVPTDSVGALETAIQIIEDWAHGMLLDPEGIDADRGAGAGGEARVDSTRLARCGFRFSACAPTGAALRMWPSAWTKPRRLSRSEIRLVRTTR